MRGSGRDRNATQTSSSPGALRVPAPAATPYKSRFAGARDAAFSKARQIQGSPVVGPRVATPAAQAPTRTTTPPARTATPPGGTTKPTAPATTTPTPAPSAPRQKDTSITDMIGRSQVRQGAPVNTGSASSDTRAIAARASVGATPKPAPSTAAAKPTPRQARLNMSFDLFDVVKGYLIGEGYADTNEAALAIMANMSEEWRGSIVEATIRSVTSPSGKRIYKSPEYSSDERANISKTTHQQKRLKQRHYASTSDERDDQRSFEHDERQEKKKRKHPTNIMNAKPGEAEHYGADDGDGYHYDTVKTDRNARKRRASGR
jgi:hypothetical protein